MPCKIFSSSVGNLFICGMEDLHCGMHDLLVPACQIFIVLTCRIFRCGMRDLFVAASGSFSHGMWDLGSACGSLVGAYGIFFRCGMQDL